MSKTILIVDDTAAMHQLVGMKKAGYRIIEACDGEDALSQLNGQIIHLIISDFNMDGINLNREVKGCSYYEFTSNRMLTTESRDSKKQKGLAVGAKALMETVADGATVGELMLP